MHTKIPLNPPFSKGDFPRDAVPFPPWEKGGGFLIAGGEPPWIQARLACSGLGEIWGTGSKEFQFYPLSPRGGEGQGEGEVVSFSPR